MSGWGGRVMLGLGLCGICPTLVFSAQSMHPDRALALYQVIRANPRFLAARPAFLDFYRQMSRLATAENLNLRPEQLRALSILDTRLPADYSCGFAHSGNRLRQSRNLEKYVDEALPAARVHYRRTMDKLAKLLGRPEDALAQFDRILSPNAIYGEELELHAAALRAAARANRQAEKLAKLLLEAFNSETKDAQFDAIYAVIADLRASRFNPIPAGLRERYLAHQLASRLKSETRERIDQLGDLQTLAALAEKTRSQYVQVLALHSIMSARPDQTFKMRIALLLRIAKKSRTEGVLDLAENLLNDAQAEIFQQLDGMREIWSSAIDDFRDISNGWAAPDASWRMGVKAIRRLL